METHFDYLSLDKKKLLSLKHAEMDERTRYLWVADARLALSEVGQKLLLQVKCMRMQLTELFAEGTRIRDQVLTTRMENATQYNQVITISGAAHNSEDSELVTVAKKKRIPFISLISFRTLNFLREISEMQEKNKKTLLSDINLLTLFDMRQTIKLEGDLGKFQYNDPLQVIELVLENEIKSHLTVVADIHRLVTDDFQRRLKMDKDFSNMVLPPD